MVHLLKLLLPGLIPSWQFFKAVEASPRVQWRFPVKPDDPDTNWQEFRPRPAHVSLPVMLGRLFWNPRWNETLYLVSLSERMMLNPTAHSADEIKKHLIAEIERTLPIDQRPDYLQFRLVFVCRDEAGLTQTATYISDPSRLSGVET